MVATVWEIAAVLDEQRVPAEVNNAVWLNVPTQRLRGEGSRSDNIWLRECLSRLTKIYLSGEYRGDPWGAIILAQWHITEGGSMARLLVPPLGVYAFRSPGTFTKIEADAVHRLSGHGQRLYAILADKKRLGRPSWTFTLEELRALLSVDQKLSYRRWDNFRRHILTPALEAINDYGTVDVRMTPQKQGRSIYAVRFDWQWKDPREAIDTVAENKRHSTARRQVQDTTDAPPMIEEHEQPEPALTWWHSLTDAERDAWADRVGRVIQQEGPGGTVFTTPRRDSDIARAAYEEISTHA